MLRQIVYQDSIIAKARDLVKELEEDGCLSAEVTTAIYDILSGIGVPNGGIHLVIGDHLYCIDDTPFAPTQCSICKEIATAITELQDGTHALVCKHHGEQARQRGLMVQ